MRREKIETRLPSPWYGIICLVGYSLSLIVMKLLHKTNGTNISYMNSLAM